MYPNSFSPSLACTAEECRSASHSSLNKRRGIITHISGETARKRQEREREREGEGREPAKENLYEAAASHKNRAGEEGRKEGGRDRAGSAVETAGRESCAQNVFTALAPSVSLTKCHVSLPSIRTSHLKHEF